ncbi:MAG TPA: hypothetical protein VFW43_00255 [Polaromonas sp.]|nr:hypothetical protein [Polaromonas sp.]
MKISKWLIEKMNIQGHPSKKIFSKINRTTFNSLERLTAVKDKLPDAVHFQGTEK